MRMGLYCWLPRGACGILVLDQGSHQCHLQWKHRVLATGPPGKPQWWDSYYPTGRLKKKKKQKNWEVTLCVQGNKVCMGKTPEKAMAAHSSPLAWKIPWTEEPGGLQPMGSLRVGHDWATSLSLFTFMHWRRKWQPTPVFFPGESQGRRSLGGCRLWGRTESDTTEATLGEAEAAAAASCKYSLSSWPMPT